MAKKKVHKIRFTKGEKLLYTTAIFAFAFALIIQVFCGASVGHLNISVEKIKYEITVQEKKVESLNMKVNELTSFDKVKDIVKDMGLAYNNDNIKVINKQ